MLGVEGEKRLEFGKVEDEISKRLEFNAQWGWGGKGESLRPVRDKSAGKTRLEHQGWLFLWHPEGQTTCTVMPLGIDTAPYMINRAVTYDKCSTVFMAYFKIVEIQYLVVSYTIFVSLWKRCLKFTVLVLGHWSVTIHLHSFLTGIESEFNVIIMILVSIGLSRLMTPSFFPAK